MIHHQTAFIHKVSIYTKLCSKKKKVDSPKLFIDIRDNESVLFALLKGIRFGRPLAVFHPRITKVEGL